MHLLIKILYLITAFLPTIITVINFDVSSFSFLQVFTVFWITFLCILNLKFIILPLGMPAKSRSSFSDASGLVALSQSLNSQFIIFGYSILSASLIFLQAFVFGDSFSNRLQITLQLLLLVVAFVMLWGFVATIEIEKHQSRPLNIDTPKELAALLDDSIKQFRSKMNLNSQDELVMLLLEIKEKLYYKINRSDSYLNSNEYSELSNKVKKLSSIISSKGDSSDVRYVLELGKKLNSLL